MGKELQNYSCCSQLLLPAFITSSVWSGTCSFWKRENFSLKLSNFQSFFRNSLPILSYPFLLPASFTISMNLLTSSWSTWTTSYLHMLWPFHSPPLIRSTSPWEFSSVNVWRHFSWNWGMQIIIEIWERFGKSWKSTSKFSCFSGKWIIWFFLPSSLNFSSLLFVFVFKDFNCWL